MEIRDQRVQNLKAISRIDKNIRPAAPRMKDSVLIGSCFQRTAAGGTHTDDTAAFPVCPVDLLRGFLRDFIVLAVHRMIQHVFLFHRPERAKSDVKRNLRDRHALVTDFLQQLLRKMQAGRGRRSRTVKLGVNGLIPLSVFQFMGDIGRQGHLSQTVQNLLKNSFIGEPNQPVSFLHNLFHLRGQDAVPEGQLRARANLLSRLYQRLPEILLDPF